jgi:hypothetical protein
LLLKRLGLASHIQQAKLHSHAHAGNSLAPATD